MNHNHILDSTTPWYEFLSYQECCYSLGCKPSITRFVRYNRYYKIYGRKKEKANKI